MRKVGGHRSHPPTTPRSPIADHRSRCYRGNERALDAVGREIELEAAQ
jgi:hypothetical protein